MKLTKRQEDILEIVKSNGPITGNQIAAKLSLTRATLRADLSILTMAGNLSARPRVGYFYVDDNERKLRQASFSNELVNDYKAFPIVLDTNASSYDAVVQLFLEDVGTIYIVDQDGFLVGVVSRKDLLRGAIGNRDLSDLPVSIIMTRMPNIIMTTPEETLYEAAKKLIFNRIDSLPVVREVDTEKKKFIVIGRITKTTITKAYAELMEQ